ncbi:hypothetical protein MHAS44199_05275 [Mycolicibacterium hassiacum DSM 44199]|nr:hypothetical protein [Mycolicibacterium hassiacum DSM 44199]PZN23179.1 MAG: hypothetical protein DIU75_06030 [Mycolicibacterium hassiacum]
MAVMHDTFPRASREAVRQSMGPREQFYRQWQARSRGSEAAAAYRASSPGLVSVACGVTARRWRRGASWAITACAYCMFILDLLLMRLSTSMRHVGGAKHQGFAHR